MQPFQQDAWLLLAPTVLFFYYFVARLSTGRKPKPGALVIRYQPPSGLSAAAARYVVTTGSDGRSLAAVIAELAARGCLRVEPSGSKYKLSRLMSDRATESKLAPEEKDILTTLFEDGPVLELTPALDQRNTAQNGRYVFHIQTQLRKRLDGLYFKRQAGAIALGVFATFVAALALAVAAHSRSTTGSVFFTMWVLFAGLCLGLLVELSFVPACKDAIRTRSGVLRILPGLAAISAFLWAIGLLLRELAKNASPALSLTILSLILVNLGWAPFLKYTTPLGRKTLDEIAGFRAFLESVERDRLEKLNPAGESPQALEEYLSYAIALEVTEAWGDHLSATFATSTVCR
ncbi:MAG TPA: hypothetical protein VOA78_11910 [Candidatus Dormibacteraeota bacterium]|nr:hypothetical protein [Candidatus Dormibacteraeota bacterium]